MKLENLAPAKGATKARKRIVVKVQVTVAHLHVV